MILSAIKLDDGIAQTSQVCFEKQRSPRVHSSKINTVTKLRRTLDLQQMSLFRGQFKTSDETTNSQSIAFRGKATRRHGCDCGDSMIDDIRADQN